VKFAYFALADASNRGPDGKVNILGLGARILTVPSLPTTVPLTLVGSVDADVAEAGDFVLRISLTEPDGSEEQVAEFAVAIPREVADPEVPTGFGFSLVLLRPVRLEGIHVVRGTVGDLVADYVYAVRVSPEPQGATGSASDTERSSLPGATGDTPHV
jgi:hypothetical protein